MKTKMQSTSLEAYESILNELPYRQSQIIEKLTKHGAMSNRQLSVELDLPINSVTGRVNELVELGLVFELDKVRDTVTGRTVIRWAIVSIGKQLELNI